MEKKERLKRGKETYLLSLDQIRVEGFNPRFHYGDLKSLSEQIESEGLLRPLVVFKNNNKEDVYYLLDGHRRFKAMKLAAQRGWDASKIPVFCERKPDEATKYLATILYNEGEKLNPLEEATVYKKLIELGSNASDVAKRVGKSVTHVIACLNLIDSNEKLIEKIKSGTVSATMVMEKLKEMSDEELNSAIEDAQETGVQRVTAKHLKLKKPSKKPANLFKLLDEDASLEASKAMKHPVIEAVFMYNEGEITYQDFLKMFQDGKV